MNPIQMALQIKHELQTATWSGGDLVFGARGSVAVFAGAPTEEQIPPGFPWALVGLDSGDIDEDDPSHIMQRFSITIAAEVAGDRMGEYALIGGAAASLTKSAGRGVGEIAERVRSAVQSLTGADGASVQLSAINTGTPAILGRGRHVAMDELTLSAVCTSALYYAPPQRLRSESVDGGDTWLWAGAHCSSRFDFLQYRLVEKAGSSPSTSPSDGTVLYTGTAAQFVAAATSGKTYTVFADYNGRGGATVEASSAVVIGSYKVVA